MGEEEKEISDKDFVAKPDVPDKILLILKDILTGKNENCQIHDEESTPVSVTAWRQRLGLRKPEEFFDIVKQMPQFFIEVSKKTDLGMARLGAGKKFNKQIKNYIFKGRTKFLKFVDSWLSK